MTAHRAEVAFKINRGGHDAPLFDTDDMTKRAATAQLREASNVNPYFNNDATRVQHLRHAAAIAELGDLLERSDDSWFDLDAVRVAVSTLENPDLGWLPENESAPKPTQLYEHALQILGHFASSDLADTTEVKFLEARADTFWLYVRALRLGRNRNDGWLATLAELDEDRFFAGTCREHYRLHIECERLAGLCQSDGTGSVSDYLASERTKLAQHEASRSWWLGRLQLVHALAQYHAGHVDDRGLLRVLTDTVSDHIPNTVTDHFRVAERQSAEFIIHQLNAALCAMDTAHRADEPDDVIFRSAKIAVDFIQELFQRWRILARSQSPLAAALRACLGDIAAVCAAHGGAVNDLGFRVATLIKQNTLSHILQNTSISLPKLIRDHLRAISQIDNQLWNADLSARTRHELSRDRRTKREQLERSIHARLHLMSLDYLDPQAVNTNDIVANLGGRPALDYVWIESTAQPHLKTWYRTFITFISPDGELDFAKQPRHFAFNLGDKRVPDDQLPELSRLLLPDGLDAVTRHGSIPELLISPHNDLDIVPWAALTLGVGRPRLVESFVLALTPCLASLSANRPGRVRGPALARLVAKEITIDGKVIGHRLNLEEEFRSWGHDYDDSFRGVLFFGSDNGQVDASDDLANVLRQAEPRYGLLHVAAHGGGSGLRGTVYLPEPFTAAEAFGVEWPAAVLLAVCHAGEIAAGRFTEPLAFCIAVLAGGASAVTAGIGQVSDEGAGLIASRMIERFRAGSAGTLPELLREAQLHAINRNVATWKWSRFVTYVR